MQSIKFGVGENFVLKDPWDTWLQQGEKRHAVPEAGGSSARVFQMSTNRYDSFKVHSRASFKVMRPDKIEYALPLFIREVQVMQLINDLSTPGITKLLELGFIKLDKGMQFPEELAPLNGDRKKASAEHLTGKAETLSYEESPTFLKQINERISDGWLPFLVFEPRVEDNIYMRCDPGYTKGKYLRDFPMPFALKAAYQICEILSKVHELGIAYLDHKILHYYWRDFDPQRPQVYIIDWNIGYGPKENLSLDEIQDDLVQLAATTFHYMFTGTLALGAKKIGPSSPDDIANSPKTYNVEWNHDNKKRLNDKEKSFLERSLRREYTSAQSLGDDLKKLYLFRV
jgi:hypothetical protein